MSKNSNGPSNPSRRAWLIGAAAAAALATPAGQTLAQSGAWQTTVHPAPQSNLTQRLEALLARQFPPRTHVKFDTETRLKLSEMLLKESGGRVIDGTYMSPEDLAPLLKRVFPENTESTIAAQAFSEILSGKSAVAQTHYHDASGKGVCVFKYDPERIPHKFGLTHWTNHDFDLNSYLHEAFGRCQQQHRNRGFKKSKALVAIAPTEITPHTRYVAEVEADVATAYAQLALTQNFAEMCDWAILRLNDVRAHGEAMDHFSTPQVLAVIEDVLQNGAPSLDPESGLPRFSEVFKRTAQLLKQEPPMDVETYQHCRTASLALNKASHQEEGLQLIATMLSGDTASQQGITMALDIREASAAMQKRGLTFGLPTPKAERSR